MLSPGAREEALKTKEKGSAGRTGHRAVREPRRGSGKTSQEPSSERTDLGAFESEIRKTGFVLENKIAEVLRAAGWSVISNKYYVDDAEETVREIDLVAYRANKAKHFNVYTTLVISCKKSESNVWALLARHADHNARNWDWWPLHVWTNDRALNYELTQADIGRRYHEQVSAKGVREALELPLFEVFAFQEMDRTSGAPRNDKAIFSAVTSLMKAQAYELAALPQRRKDPAVYQFNLLSIVDADLLRLEFAKGDIAAKHVNSEHYITRYIIGKKETFARVRFLRAKAFDQQLEDYLRLHQANLAWFSEYHDRYYSGAIERADKREVFLDDFRREVGGRLAHVVSRARIGEYAPHPVELDWVPQTKKAVVYIPADSQVAAFLNSDAEARKAVAVSLRKIYRYEGDFEFEPDIPF